MRRSLLLALVFAGSFAIFLASPVRQVTDAGCLMAISENLLAHGSFDAARYLRPPLEPERHPFDRVGTHLYPFYPPGSPVLAAPFVALMNLFGVSAIGADGNYDRGAEVPMHALLAALLMAALAAIFFTMGRRLLPDGWSLIVAFGGALGTQVWGTASRGVWSDTWGILLLGGVVLMLLAHESEGRPLRPVLLATLLSWTYLVKPNYSVHIVAVTVYLAVAERRALMPYAATGAAWFALLVAYAWSHFGTLLPRYYMLRLSFNTFLEGLAGTWISPSRGLLVYVPVLLFVAWLVVRHRSALPHRRLVLVAVGAILGHMLALAMWSNWWGGQSYGPRLATGIVPWLVLLALEGIAAMRARGESRAAMPAGAVFLALSIAIQSRGALSQDAWDVNLDEHLFDWRHLQFLTGFVPFPLPATLPPYLPGTRIEPSRPESETYLLRGWGGAEPEYRWTNGKSAEIVFALDPRSIGPLTLEMELSPFIAQGRGVEEQRVRVELNEQKVGEIEFLEPGVRTIAVRLPGEHLRARNRITLLLPDAVAPQALGLSGDDRRLALAVRWIRMTPQ